MSIGLYVYRQELSFNWQLMTYIFSLLLLILFSIKQLMPWSWLWLCPCPCCDYTYKLYFNKKTNEEFNGAIKHKKTLKNT